MAMRLGLKRRSRFRKRKKQLVISRQKPLRKNLSLRARSLTFLS
jgi:hypothetical protein